MPVSRAHKCVGTLTQLHYCYWVLRVQVLRACVQNCGKPFQVAMCNYQFASDIKRLLSGKSTANPRVQNELKAALLAWELDFAGDLQLSLIRGTVNELRADGVTFEVVETGGGSGGGDAQGKTAQAQQAAQEEDDLAMAMAASLSMEESKKSQSQPRSASSKQRKAKVRDWVHPVGGVRRYM